MRALFSPARRVEPEPETDAPATDFDWPPLERDEEWTAHIGSEWQAFQQEASRAFSERHPDAAHPLPEAPPRRRWLLPSMVDVTAVIVTSALLVWWVQSRATYDAAAPAELPLMHHAAQAAETAAADPVPPAKLEPGATIVVTYPVGNDAAERTNAARTGGSAGASAQGRGSNAPAPARSGAASPSRSAEAAGAIDTPPVAATRTPAAPPPDTSNPPRPTREATPPAAPAVQVPAPEATRLARRDDLRLPGAGGPLNAIPASPAGAEPSPPAPPERSAAGRPTSSPPASARSTPPSTTAAPSNGPAADAPASTGSSTTAATGSPALPAARHAADDVRRVLARYEAALEGLDVQQAAALFARPDTAALQRAFAQLRRQEVEFDDCDVTAASTVATAVCKGTLRYVPAVGSSDVRERRVTWSLQLTREGDQWQISRLQAR